jgi:hypothetical protein
MKKKDLVETAVLLLGLWLLYKSIATISYVLMNGSLNFFFNDYSEEVSRYIVVNLIFTFSYLTGAFVCFKRKDWLIQNTGLHSEEETLLQDNLISKRDVLETGIVIVSLALVFQTLPDLLKNFFDFFRSRAGNDYVDYEFTQPFIMFLVPLLSIIMRDKIADIIYSKKNKPDENV